MADRADAEELPRQASPVRNPGSAVYGVVLADSLLAIEGDGHVGVPRLVLTVLATQCVYWLAHIYAELVGGRIVTGRRPHRGEVGRLMAEEWPMVTASFGPLAVTLVAWALGAPVETAVLWGLWAGTLLLAGWALLAGLRAHLRIVELLLYVLVSTAFGVLLVALKTVVH